MAPLTLSDPNATLALESNFGIVTLLTVTAGTLEINGDINNPTIDVGDTGSISIGTAATLIATTLTGFVENATVTNAGTVMLEASTRIQVNQSFTNTGSVELTGGGWLSADGGFGGAGGTVNISGGSHFGVSGTIAGTNTFTFGTGSNNVLDVDTAQVMQGTIVGMSAGDLIALSSASQATLGTPIFTAGTVSGTGTLSYTDTSSGTWTFALSGLPAGTTSASFKAVKDSGTNSDTLNVKGVDLELVSTGTAPTIMSFTTSGSGITNGSGDLTVGQTATITLNSSAALTVAGTPSHAERWRHGELRGWFGHRLPGLHLYRIGGAEHPRPGRHRDRGHHYRHRGHSRHLQPPV